MTPEILKNTLSPRNYEAYLKAKQKMKMKYTGEWIPTGIVFVLPSDRYFFEYWPVGSTVGYPSYVKGYFVCLRKEKPRRFFSYPPTHLIEIRLCCSISQTPNGLLVTGTLEELLYDIFVFWEEWEELIYSKNPNTLGCGTLSRKE